MGVLEFGVDVNEREAREQVEMLARAETSETLVGRLRRVPGHVLFSYNRDTGEIKKAEVVRLVEVDLEGRPCYRERVSVEAGCYYEQALNRRNFEKRLRRRGLLK